MEGSAWCAVQVSVVLHSENSNEGRMNEQQDNGELWSAVWLEHQS